MRRHGAAHVYLATDCDDARELREVEAALSPARYAPPRPPPGQAAARKGSGQELLERTTTANIEIAICAMAAGFRGTKSSSFSLAITEEREAVFGHPRETGGDMDTLPPAGDSASSVGRDPNRKPKTKDEL